MWYKLGWMGHSVRLDLTREDLLVSLANHYTTLSAYKGSNYKENDVINYIYKEIRVNRINRVQNRQRLIT